LLWRPRSFVAAAWVSLDSSSNELSQKPSFFCVAPFLAHIYIYVRAH
jgi:hypothetical protein